MVFQSIKEMSDAVKPAAAVLSDRVSVTNPAAITGELIDRLAWTSVFGADPDLRGTARWIVRRCAMSCVWYATSCSSAWRNPYIRSADVSGTPKHCWKSCHPDAHRQGLHPAASGVTV